jgi:hypothetical protein
VDATVVNNDPASPFRNVDFIGDAPYYFITDNDCLAPVNENGFSFDEYGFRILDENPRMPRVGYLLFRQIYVERYPEWSELKSYIYTKEPVSDPKSDELKVCAGRGNGIWNDETRKLIGTSDGRLVKLNSDTTFTIVRKPNRLSASNRYSSFSTTAFPISHIGYLERWFYRKDHADEMLEYMIQRSKNICPEFKETYQNREGSYRGLLDRMKRASDYHIDGDKAYHNGNSDKAVGLWTKGAELGSKQCKKNLEWSGYW